MVADRINTQRTTPATSNPNTLQRDFTTLEFSLLLLFGYFGREFALYKFHNNNTPRIVERTATIHKEPLTQTMFQTQLNFDQKSTGEAIYIQRNKFERRTHNAMYQTETEMARMRANGSGKRTKSNVRLYCELWVCRAAAAVLTRANERRWRLRERERVCEKYERILAAA